DMNRPSKARVSISSNFAGSKEKSRLSCIDLSGSARRGSSYPSTLYIAILSAQPTPFKMHVLLDQ
ncbi:hypothetical protein, partial [Brucella canis]|uniref:hypothetical protein n=1 Tax=Brucella canis TaxID=36855 RepID=UPI0019D6E319